MTSEEALWNIVKSGWDHQVLHKLVESIPAQVHTVINISATNLE